MVLEQSKELQQMLPSHTAARVQLSSVIKGAHACLLRWLVPWHLGRYKEVAIAIATEPAVSRYYPSMPGNGIVAHIHVTYMTL